MMQALVERCAASGVVTAGWRVLMLLSQSRWWSLLTCRWISSGPIFELRISGLLASSALPKLLAGSLAWALQHPSVRVWMLLLAGLAAGLTYLARYAGASVVAAGLVAVLIYDRQSLRRRLFHGLLYGAAGAVGCRRPRRTRLRPSVTSWCCGTGRFNWRVFRSAARASRATD